jgi:hypothetical protein
VNSSPQRRDEFLVLQEGRESVAVTLILDVKTRWNSTLAMLERAYRLRNYTEAWIALHPEFSMLGTSVNEWRAMEYLMEILEPFRYYTLWMSKQKNVMIHWVVRIYNDLFDHLKRIIKVLHNKRTQWKVSCHVAVKVARLKLMKYYSELNE